MKIDKEKTMDVMVYTAESPEIAAMLVDGLRSLVLREQSLQVQFFN